MRGAANRILSIPESELDQGVIACSSGNHGRAVAHMAGTLGIPAVICVPDWVSPVKLKGIKDAGARVVLSGESYDLAEAMAYRIAEAEGRTFVQPFDDPWTAAGQGTLGLELLEQMPGLETVLIPLSGGGLAGGVAYALKERHPSIRIVGVSAKNARVMYESLLAGHPASFPEDETVASALSGGIGLDNAHTFTLVSEYVDKHVLVSEEEIRTAMVFAAREHKLVVEGGGAVGIAAVLAEKVGRGSKSMAVVVSGGNIDMKSFGGIVSNQ